MFPLAKKETKTSAKNLAKSAITLKASIVFAVQPLMEDTTIKTQLEKLDHTLKDVEKTLLDKAKQDTTELSKQFEKTETELEKIRKKIKGFQDYLESAEKSMQGKLTSKINNLKEAKKDAKAQDEYKKQAELLIGEMTIILNNAKNKITPLTEHVNQLMKQYVILKPKLAVFSLPENISQSDKQAKKLKERLEQLCESTSGITATALASSGIDKEKVASFLPRLQSSIRVCGQLVDQALFTLNPLLMPNRNAANANAINGSAVNGSAANAVAAGASANMGAAAASSGMSANTGSSTAATANADASAAGSGSNISANGNPVPNAQQYDAKNDSVFRVASHS